MSTNNQFTSNFKESTAENNVDLGSKFVSKSYLIDVYPYLDGLGGLQIAGLWGWGRNEYGQLGDNSTSNRSVPVQTISTGTTWKQIAGNSATAAIKSDGTLWGWGLNSSGQLGDNTLTSRSSPIQTVAVGTNWVAVGVGSFNTIAIKDNGTLWAWGANNFGQLGTNNRTNRSSPVQTVTFGNTWKQCDSGSSFCMAIKSDGTLWGFGYNSSGNLADGTSSHRSSPVQTIAFGSTWKQVACGGYTAVAVKTDGTLWTWGDNTYGQLGDSTSTPKSSPIQTIARGTNWKQCATSGYSVVAIKTDGTLWSWGDNTYGQLGDNTSTRRSSPIQTIVGGTNWKSAINLLSSTAAIKTDGSLWSWGDNLFTQLGDNTNVTKSSPVQVYGYSNNWKSIAGTYYTMVGIKEMGDDF